HQCENFVLGPLPILGREGVEGEVLDLQLAARFDAGADCVGAFLVAFDPCQATLGSPATVTIHDDRDVARGRSWGSRHSLPDLNDDRLGTRWTDADEA